MFKRIAILAALAAGTVLLTACGATESASGTERGASARANVELTTGDEEPVDCGEVEANGSTHTLVATPAGGGIVGCTEAFNVVGEYLAIPAADRDLNGTDLANGWTCVTDDGETAGIGCVKGSTGDGYGFAFSTTPV
jgi:hypothetical protein